MKQIKHIPIDNHHDIVCPTVDIPFFHNDVLCLDPTVGRFKANFTLECGFDDVIISVDDVIGAGLEARHQHVYVIGVHWVSAVSRGALGHKRTLY